MWLFFHFPVLCDTDSNVGSVSSQYWLVDLCSANMQSHFSPGISIDYFYNTLMCIIQFLSYDFEPLYHGYSLVENLLLKCQGALYPLIV
uniref:Uncharacterized protein n=1 Tax=Arundo donax TaxID=35708 RepID=A0A0A9E5M6_ARUDO